MTQERLCEICAGRPAVSVFVRRRGAHVVRVRVCSECAGDRARLVVKNLDIQAVVSGFGRGRGPDPSSAYTCSLCGTTLADIVTGGDPGCSACYARFSAEILPLIHKAQGRERHVGKTRRR